MKLKSTLLLAAIVAAMFPAIKAAAQNKKEVQLLPTIVSSASFTRGAGEMRLPDAPSHKFLDTQNMVSMSALTTLVAIDGATTQHLMQDYKFREMNPVARPLVTRGSAGQGVACAVGLSAAVGAAYLLHKRGHHRLERWTLRLSIAGESAAVINNVVKTP